MTFPESRRIVKAIWLVPLLMMTAGVLVAGLPVIANALPLMDTPDGGSVFHGGDTLAWYRLDASHSNTWDPLTGALEAHVMIFADDSFDAVIGTATASSTNLLGENFNHFSGGILGTIDSVISLSSDSDFRAYMEDRYGSDGTFTYSVTMTFLDVDYMDPWNSWRDNVLSLWGADGFDEEAGDFGDSGLGTDMMVHAPPIPEPGTLVLLGTGLAGLGVRAWSSRRRKRVGTE